MNDVNMVFIIGRLVKDIELQHTAGGKAVAKFSIANNDDFGEKKYVNFFDVTVWEKQAETCAKYLSKGSQIAITGKLKQNRWKNKEGQTQSKVEINAQSVQFLGTPKEKTVEDPWGENA